MHGSHFFIIKMSRIQLTVAYFMRPSLHLDMTMSDSQRYPLNRCLINCTQLISIVRNWCQLYAIDVNCTQLISIVRYHFYNFQNRFNSTVVSLQSDSRQFYWRTHIEIIRLVEKRQYLPHFLSDVGIKGIVVNRTLPSLNGVSLETILPNPLKTREKNLTCMYLVSKLLKDFFYSQIDVVQKDLSK